MPAIVVTDKILMTFYGELAGQKILNTFPLVVTAVTGAPDLNDALDVLFAKVNAVGELRSAFLNCCATNYTLTQIWLQCVFPVRYKKRTYPVGMNGAGEDVSAAANIAGVITRTGDLAKRNNTGSLHVPIGSTSLSIVGGRLTATQKGLMTTLGTKMKGTIGTDGLVVDYSFSLWGNQVGNLPVPVTAAVPQDTSRVMRRRTVGLGI